MLKVVSFVFLWFVWFLSEAKSSLSHLSISNRWKKNLGFDSTKSIKVRPLVLSLLFFLLEIGSISVLSNQICFNLCLVFFIIIGSPSWFWSPALLSSKTISNFSRNEILKPGLENHCLARCLLKMGFSLPGSFCPAHMAECLIYL